jgi:hypothetical protein
MRQVLSILIPLLAPSLLYLYFKTRSGSPVRIAAKDAPWVWLVGVGISLVAVGLIVWGLTSGGTPTAKYVPSQFKDGRITSGKFIEKDEKK